MFRMSKAYDRRIASGAEDFALALARAALYTSSKPPPQMHPIRLLLPQAASCGSPGFE